MAAITGNAKFEPFGRPEPALTAPRSEIVERLMQVLNRPSSAGFAIISGDLGDGKTTILQNILPGAFEPLGYRVVYVLCSASLNAAMLIDSLAKSLDLYDKDVLRRYGVSEKGTSQEAGRIDASTSVYQQQVSQSQDVSLAKSIDNNDIHSALNAFQKLADAPLLICFDQLEAIFQPNRFEARTLIERLLSAASPECKMVFSVRSDFVSSILSFASAYHELPGSIVPVPGLTEAEARRILTAGAHVSGLSFSEALVTKIIDASKEYDGRIWPIGLSALAKKIVETAMSRSRKRVTIRDFVEVGEIVGAVKLVISDTLGVLSREQQSEAWYMLREFAKFAITQPVASVSDITSIAFAYPQSQIEAMFQALESLRLVKRLPNNSLMLAHDVIAAALKSEDGLSSKIDQGLDLWLVGNGNYDRLSDLQLEEALLVTGLPLPKLMFLAEQLFQLSEGTIGKLRAKLREHLRNKEARIVSEFVAGRAGKIDPGRRLSASDIFVLLLDDRAETLALAVKYGRPRAERTGGAIPQRYSFGAALNLASPEKLGEVISSDELFSRLSGDMQLCTAILRYLSARSLMVEQGWVERLFFAVNEAVKPEALSLARRLNLERAVSLAERECNSENALLRASALGVLVEAELSAANVERCLNDGSTIVRRRAVFSIASHGNAGQEALQRLFADPSPFVREAVLEVIGSKRIANMVGAVKVGLSDEYDFVKESAAYALKDIVPVPEAVACIKPLLRDESPYVREAASRILSDAGHPVDPFAAVSHLRSGRSGLKSATLKAIGYTVEGDLEDVLIDFLNREGGDRQVIVLALQLLSQLHSVHAASYISKFLYDDDPDVVEAAVVCIQNSDGRMYTAALAQLVDHQSVDVRERVVYALADLGGDEAIMALKQAIWDPAGEVVCRAVYGLARLNAYDARELIRLVVSADPDVNRAKEYFERVAEEKRKNA